MLAVAAVEDTTVAVLHKLLEAVDVVTEVAAVVVSQKAMHGSMEAAVALGDLRVVKQIMVEMAIQE
jgi:hypothetical protein